MIRNEKLNYKPETITHPGEIVADYLEHLDWSQRDLSRRTGITPKTISKICNGKTSITPHTAVLFENVLKRPARFWLNLQQKFDENAVRNKIKSKVYIWESWSKNFPLAEMKRFGWIEEKSESTEVNTLLDFFGVSSPKSWNLVWESANVAYRQTRKFKTSNEAISAWVRATELMATNLETEVEVNSFNEIYLYSIIEEIRKLTNTKPEHYIPELTSLCAKAGVLVVWVPELKQTGISGCARWLSDKKALIALTLRYKTDDQMWFTFFHELGHVLLHRKDKVFILDNAYDHLRDGIIDPPMQVREEEANRFASDTLIPPNSLFEFISKGNYKSQAIYNFSNEIGIAPGIIVGRLQQEKVLSYHQGNSFKQKLNWAFRE